MLLAFLLAQLLTDPASLLLYAALLSAAFGLAGGYGGKFWASFVLRREVRRLAGELEILRGMFEDRIDAIDKRVKRREGEAGQAAKGPRTPPLPKEPEPDSQAAAELKEILGARKPRVVRGHETVDAFDLPTMEEGRAALAREIG